MSAWQLLTERPSGTVAALASVAGRDGAPLVFAAATAGLHRSSDGGVSWIPLGAGDLTPPVETVGLSPSFAEDGTLFVGTPSGLYRSTDAGRSWQLVLVGSRMLAVALSPGYTDDRLLLVGTESDGILRSEDGGRTWASANPGLLDLTVLALGLSPRFDLDRTAYAATASGLYRTRNGGKSWRAIDLGVDELAVQCLAVSPSFAEDRLVLAGTEAEGLRRSEDAGADWEPVAALAGQGVAAIAFSSRYPDPPAMAAATAEGVVLSSDGGLSWRTVAADLGPVLSLAFVPDRLGEKLLAGLARRGVARLDPETGAWSPANDGLRANLLVSLAISPGFEQDRTLFATGLEDGAAVSRDGGATWAPCNEGLADPTVLGLGLSPRFPDDQTLYAATAGGIYRSRDGAATWHRALSDALPAAGRAVATGPQTDDGFAPVAAALQGGRVLLSEDGGEHWRAAGPNLGGAEVFSLAFSPAYPRDQTVFLGASRPPSDDPNPNDLSAKELALWCSANGDGHWQCWLVGRGPGVLPLAISPEYAIDGMLFVGLGGQVMTPRGGIQEVVRGERRPLWRGVDLPADAGVITALSLSPAYREDGTLIAATSRGIFRSRDRGASFSPWAEGQPRGPIVALAVSPDFARDRLVYAIGLGGTIWRGEAT